MDEPPRPDVRSSAAAAWRAAPITVALIAINVLVFFLENAWGGSRSGDTLVRMGAVYSANFPEFRIAAVLTYAYLHIGPAHIGMNMLALYNLGRFLEPLLGAARFFTLYTLSAIGGGVLIAILPSSHVTAGASGAIFGLLGAVLVLFLRRYRATRSNEEKSAIRGSIARMLLPNVIISLLPGISFLGHLGGLVVGAACMVGVLVVGKNRILREESVVADVLSVVLALVTVLCVGSEWALFQPWATQP